MFKVGQIVEFHPSSDTYRAKAGALAVVQEPDARTGEEYVNIRWVDQSIGQNNGNYFPENFRLPGRSTLANKSAGERKQLPLVTGVYDYFPDALLAVAEVSRVGNEQHHPGQPLHWDKSKSTDEADSLARHLLERGTRDTDGCRHSAKVAWRALAMLQREIDAERK